VAYLDGTLFHRDASAIDRHVEGCAECTALLQAMRQKRAAEQASTASRWRLTIGGAVVVVAVLGYLLWTVLPRSEREQDTNRASVRNDTPLQAVPAPAAAAAPVGVPSPVPAPAPAPAPSKPPPSKPLPRAAVTTPVSKPKSVAAKPVAPRVMWRTRDLVVESSTDGGMTWATEHTADRPIRGSAFVNADVAWVVGDSGLILRRTKNGWFGASPPADGNITAVKASSPSRATVTLEDGRVFTTANGGVTWTAAP
jgi:hypothetical protein